jgi:hypothetical protein
MNRQQAALENVYQRAGDPTTLLYENVPVTDITTGETTMERTRVRRPLDNITYEPKDEREDRERRQQKSRNKRRKKEIKDSNESFLKFIINSNPQHRENKPESVHNVFADIRNIYAGSDGVTSYASQIERILVPAGIMRPTPTQARRMRDEEIARQAFEGVGLKTSNPWMNHVRQFAKEHHLTYWEAIKNPRCKSSYRR